MSRRLTAFILAAVLGMGGLAHCALAEDEPDRTALEAAAKADDTLPARSAVLMEQQTGRVLFEKNADEQLPPASITKIMTLLLVMEAIDSGQMRLEDKVVCSEHAASMGGSQIWFEPGEEMTVDDLLKATAISSANDASVALAEYIAGSEDAFVQMMNDRASQLGMENTHFENATGLDAPGHVSTARDIATMGRELLMHPLIQNYSQVWMAELRGGQTQLVNTNKLVRFYNGCTGLKTGTTDGAGSCLCASATRKGLSLVAVTLGSATSADRFSAARGLLDHGFANFLRVELPPIELPGPVPVRRGVAATVQVVSEQPDAVLVRSGDQVKLRQEISMAEDVEAPVESGQILGTVTVTVDGEELIAYNLVAADDVGRMTMLQGLGMLLKSLTCLG